MRTQKYIYVTIKRARRLVQLRTRYRCASVPARTSGIMYVPTYMFPNLVRSSEYKFLASAYITRLDDGVLPSALRSPFSPVAFARTHNSRSVCRRSLAHRCTCRRSGEGTTEGKKKFFAATRTRSALGINVRVWTTTARREKAFTKQLFVFRTIDAKFQVFGRRGNERFSVLGPARGRSAYRGKGKRKTKKKKKN